MQKTEKAPKRANSSSSTTTLGNEPGLRQVIRSVADFQERLVSINQNYLSIAENAQNAKMVESLHEQLTGLQFCFEKLHIEGEQLISVGQGTLAHMARIQNELEKDHHVRNDAPSQQNLETTQQTLLALNDWLSHYQSQFELQQQLQQQTPPLHGAIHKTGPAKHHAAAGTAIGPSPISNGDIILQEYILALNVNTTSAFLNALKNLNQFLEANPTVPVSLSLFYSLFNQLDKTMQALPEHHTTGLPQRQLIANMVAVNRQTNRLYGFLMGRQII